MKARFLAFAALVLGLASCQNEPEGINAIGSDEVSVVLNVTVPEDITRAGGTDSAKGAIGNIDLTNDYDVRFILEVYDADGELAKERFTNYENTATSTAFDLRLVPGRDYKFVVWADFVEQVNVTRDPATNYDLHYNTQDLKNITVNAATWKAMDESRDAYTGYHDAVKFNSTQAINIELKRPFAKLRVVTTDMDDLYNVVPEDVKVTYNTNKLYTTFNAYTSKAVADNAVANRVHEFKLSASEYSNDAEGTKTLFADYMFGAENGTVKFTMDVVDTNGGVIPTIVFNTDIPVERNYLTTIIGPVLTDSGNVKVTINDAFEDEEIIYEVWDGKSVSEPSTDANGNYIIKKGSELAWLADQVNGVTRAAANTFAGKTFLLEQDIDLGGNEWTPIGKNTGDYFKGTFDGQGHTITGLNITRHCGHNSHALFGGVAGSASIKNLVIDGANVAMPESHDGDFYAAGLIGSYYGTISIDNVVVKNSTFVGNNKVAGLIAHDGSSSNITINNCHIENCTIKSIHEKDGGNVGGLMGIFQGTGTEEHKITNSSVKKCTIVGINSSNSGKRANSQFIGGTISKAGQILIIENCVVEDNDFTQTFNVAEGDSAYVGKYDNKFIGGDRDEKYIATVIINGTRYEANEEPKNVSAEDGNFYATIEEALGADNNEVTLGDGEFTLPSGIATDTTDGNTTVTISGNGIDKSIVNGSNNPNGNNQQPGNYAHGLDLVFENLTYETVNNGYQGGFGHAKSVTFRNCKIVGQMYAHSNAPHYFYDCIIDPLNGYLYTYASDCVFERCHFAASQGKALQVYAEAAGTFTTTITDCTFKAEKQATTYDGKPVTGIDINSAYGANMVVHINNSTTEGFPVGLNSNSDLWNIKNGGLNKTTLYIDGNVVWLPDYTLVAGYPGLFSKDGEFYVFDVVGLGSLNKYFQNNCMANEAWGRTYNIAADIDAEGFTWQGVYMITGDNTRNGIVIDGNNHTISNITIQDYLLSGTADGADDGTTPGEFRDLTLTNAKVNGGWFTAPLWGNLTGDINFTNVHILNSEITGTNNVGGIISSTGEGTDYYITFENCSVENTKITAVGAAGQDPTGASGFMGRAFGLTYITFKGNNQVVNNTIANENGLVGGKVFAYTTWKDNGFAGTGVCDTFTNFDGVKFVEADDITETEKVGVGDNVTMTDDITGSANDTTASSGYGKTGITVNGGVFDGQGYSIAIDDAWGTWDCAIATTGGTIKNVNVIRAMRGIFVCHNDSHHEKLYLDNVHVDGTIYTISCDQAHGDGLEAVNCSFNGWTSYAATLGEAKFVNCSFGEGQGYAFCRPYSKTIFENCNFEKGYELDPRAEVVLKGCTYDGIHITKDNYTTLVTSNAQNVRFE